MVNTQCSAQLAVQQTLVSLKRRYGSVTVSRLPQGSPPYDLPVLVSDVDLAVGAWLTVADDLHVLVANRFQGALLTSIGIP